VAEIVPDGWDLIDVTCTSSKGDTETEGSISLQAGETVTCVFTNQEYAKKKGRKWHDMNEDGLWDVTEPFLSGWTIELYKEVDTSWTFVMSDTTNTVGMYKFEGLTPGTTYLVCEVLELGYFQTYPKIDTIPPKDETLVNCQLEIGAGYGEWGYKFTPEAGELLTGNNFGNDRELGCTLTQGYWKTHGDPLNERKYDETWDEVGGSDALFLDTGQTWMEVFNTAPSGGNAFYILAHQYMAAILNTLKADNPADPTLISEDLTMAAALLDYYDDPPYIPDDGHEFAGEPSNDRALAISIAETLDMFNNGLLPGGPPHCEE
jgi:hypothetical protein